MRLYNTAQRGFFLFFAFPYKHWASQRKNLGKPYKQAYRENPRLFSYKNALFDDNNNHLALTSKGKKVFI